jgi:hypothetical protein
MFLYLWTELEMQVVILNSADSGKTKCIMKLFVVALFQVRHIYKG